MRRKPRSIPLFAAVVRPLQAFLRLEASSGVVLLAAAIAALALANGGWSDAYRAVLRAPIALGVGPLRAESTLAALVNDGLMAVFFFVVGMEIKRELAVGELRTLRQALLPAIAAVGGMLVPAGIFVALNRGGPGAHGWGIPMATDIAFCVGVLTLLRGRVPNALVVFVTALAIFDDIGGILVIAIFYGGGIHAGWLLAAAAITAGLVLLGRASVQHGAAYAAAGVLLWWALHHAGIHAAISGVVVGLCVPARPRAHPRDVLEGLAAHARRLLRRADGGTGEAPADDAPADEELGSEELVDIEARLQELEAPLTRFVHRLHPWVAFGIMPLFALANSGVDLRALAPAQLAGRVAIGVAAGLLVGKLAGISASTWLAVRLGAAPMPGGASPAKLVGVSTVAGIGFTVALFIAGLAYPGHPELLDEAKVGILAGSLAAGVVGAIVLRLTPRVGAGARASGAAAPAGDPRVHGAGSGS